MTDIITAESEVKEPPTITVDGKTIKAKNPKTKLWRKIVEFNKKYKDKDAEDFNRDLEQYEDMLQLMADCFSDDRVTPEMVEDAIDLDDFLPAFYKYTGWVAWVITAKLKSGNTGKNSETAAM